MNIIAEFVGTVVEGDKVGRTLGFPTANLDTKNHGLKKAGVYCGWVLFEEERHAAVLCVNWENVVEVHLIGFDKDIYGKTISVDVRHFIRDMEKIDDIEKLKVAIAGDVYQAAVFLTP
jgi:riboflavin kinase / FMN adenylyltransferase